MRITSHCTPHDAAACVHCYCKVEQCCAELACQHRESVCCKCGARQSAGFTPYVPYTPWPWVQPYRPWWEIQTSDGTNGLTSTTVTGVTFVPKSSLHTHLT